MTNNEMDWLVYVYKNAWETKWGRLFQGGLNRFLIFPRGFSLDINTDLAPLPFSISTPSLFPLNPITENANFPWAC